MTGNVLPSVPLYAGGRATSKLGFGCSGISGGLARRQSLALLEAAFDAGIRHFDVAPMYGFGTAEEVLGEFVQRHAGCVTVATKYGIPAPTSGAAINTLRTMVRPLVNRVPSLRRTLIRKATQLASTAAGPHFFAEDALRSLDSSLRKLRIERLDLLLLHEASAIDLTDERLLRVLQDAQSNGKIAQFGVASPRHTAQEVSRVHPKYCPVLQHEWSVLEPTVLSAQHSYICHRTIAGGLQPLKNWLTQNPVVQAAWSEQVAVDLSKADRLAELLLQVSCHQVPGVVLFSSRQQKRIQRHAQCSTDPTVSASACRLEKLIRANLTNICGAPSPALNPDRDVTANTAFHVA